MGLVAQPALELIEQLQNAAAANQRDDEHDQEQDSDRRVGDAPLPILTRSGVPQLLTRARL